jgi:hypothetical protein
MENFKNDNIKKGSIFIKKPVNISSGLNLQN